MATQNRHQVLSVLRANHTELAVLGVRRYGLFGSFARDHQQSASDVDLLVDLEPEKKTFSFLCRDIDALIFFGRRDLSFRACGAAGSLQLCVPQSVVGSRHLDDGWLW